MDSENEGGERERERREKVFVVFNVDVGRVSENRLIHREVRLRICVTTRRNLCVERLCKIYKRCEEKM